jgi:hypothetical protein
MIDDMCDPPHRTEDQQGYIRTAKNLNDETVQSEMR